MAKHKHAPLTCNYPITDHYNGTHFFNPQQDTLPTLRDVFKMLSGRRNEVSWPKFVANTTTPMLAEPLSKNQCHLTYINHATHLIQLPGLTVLTDPIFSKRAGPGSFIGPKRVREPGIPLAELPHIDVVVISHNHYDHMDLPSLIKLERRFHPLFIVPLGNKRYLHRKHIHRVHELDWWESYPLNDNQEITLVPALHWSKRTINDENKALWGGFWIKSFEQTVYFAGDTAYADHFIDIREKMGNPTISILPIGSYKPRWFMQSHHMDPEEAVRASLDLASNYSVATHHQTFRLSYEGYDEPVKDLRASMEKYGVPPQQFLAPDHGETLVFHEQELMIG